jgi:hypothetical protein
MKRGTCPKCSSTEIYRVAGVGARSYVSLGVFRSVRTVEFICTSCGYIESYLRDTPDMAKVREHGSRLRTAAKDEEQR